jgi:hypothetical protein
MFVHTLAVEQTNVADDEGIAGLFVRNCEQRVAQTRDKGNPERWHQHLRETREAADSLRDLYLFRITAIRPSATAFEGEAPFGGLLTGEASVPTNCGTGTAVCDSILRIVGVVA